MYTCCTLVIIVVIYFLYVELIIHACEKVIQGIMVSEEYPYCLAFIVIMVRRLSSFADNCHATVDMLFGTYFLEI